MLIYAWFLVVTKQTRLRIVISNGIHVYLFFINLAWMVTMMR